MATHIPLMFVPQDLANKLANKIMFIGENLSKIFVDVKKELKYTNLEVNEDRYLTLSVINALFMGGLFGGLITFLLWAQKKPTNEVITLGSLIFLGLTFMFFIIYINFPRILAEKKGEEINKDLNFALKDISLQISAGVNLYDCFVTVAQGKYNIVSEEFEKTVQNIQSGIPMIDALDIMSERTKSEYLKRTSWQIVNSLKSGSNLKKILKRIIKDLTIEQRSKIQNYARELNLWSLIYMMFAVAVPSIGSTMLVILSSFAGFGITRTLFIVFILMSFLIQYALIGFVKTRRPISFD